MLILLLLLPLLLLILHLLLLLFFQWLFDLFPGHIIPRFLSPITPISCTCAPVSRIEQFGDVLSHFVVSPVPRISAGLLTSSLLSRSRFGILLTNVLCIWPAHLNILLTNVLCIWPAHLNILT